MVLSYPAGAAPIEDKLNIDVVTLEERQESKRRIINEYDKNITFTVKSGGSLGAYAYKWDLNGDGTRDSGAWESGGGAIKTVKYSAAASGAGKVQLLCETANRRKVYNISVALNDQFILSKNIRVALGCYVGTPLGGGTTPQGRDAEIQNTFSWNNTTPIAFDNTGQGYGRAEQEQIQQLYGSSSYTIRTINDNNRIFYALDQSNRIAATLRTGCVRDRKNFGTNRGILVYASYLTNIPWDHNFTREALTVTVEHEANRLSHLQEWP